MDAEYERYVHKTQSTDLTVVHLRSESGDHYLSIYDGHLDGEELMEAVITEFEDEAEYLSIERKTWVKFNV